MSELAIQIVNYRTKRYLTACLASVVADLRNAKFSYEINVLDNASGDDVSGLIQQYQGRVRFWTSEQNLGFGGGHNLLATKTDARLLLLLNPDIMLTEADTIKRLLESRERTSAAVLGPKLVNGQGEPQPYDHSELKGLKAYIALQAGHSHWFERSTLSKVAWVSGAAFLIERTVFDSAGGFDEGLFLYKEEEDLCLAIRRNGGAVLYDPSVTMLHHGSVVASKSEFLPQSIKYYIEKNFPNRRKQQFFNFLYNHVSKFLR